MASIRDKFVRETEEEKELYETVRGFHYGNPFYNINSQMDSAEKIHAFLDQKISGLITGQVQLAGTRWSIHANEKQTPSYSVAGFAGSVMFDILDCICQWAANDTCSVSRKAKKIHDGCGYPEESSSEILLIGPEQIVRAHIVLSPCKVPKKIKSSRTDGIRIDGISWENDCTLREFFGEDNVRTMQETLLSLWLASALAENQVHPYADTPEEIAGKAGMMQEITGKYLEEKRKLDGSMQGKPELKPLPELELNEVVITKSDKVILDIGLVDSVSGDGRSSVLSRNHSSLHGEESHYGGVEYCRWHHTGIFLSTDQWKEISLDKAVEEICSRLGIPYHQTEYLADA